MPSSISSITTERRPREVAPVSTQKKTIRAYLMDLWSFIPYYMAHLCSSLPSVSVQATLGSSRYHLDREYFHKLGLAPDPLLFDLGGGIRQSLVRRLVKSCEYVVNLIVLALRLSPSRCDILHVQFFPFLERGFSFEIWFIEWMRRRGIPVVYTVHNAAHKGSPDRHRLLYQRAYKTADALICHGEEAKAELVRDFGIPAAKIRVIPHGPLFQNAPDQSPQAARAKLGLPIEDTIVLCLGVISEYKGLPFLLDAWKRVTGSGTKGRLLIAGTGDPRLLSSLREKVRANGIESSVDLWLHFIPVDQVPLLYQAADALVYPYKAGTTSGALLTGLSYRKAIIATQLPFFREYLRHDENGLLVDYGDVEALTSSLRLLLDQPDERDRIASKLESRASLGPTWLDIARATRQCYEEILKDYPSHTRMG